MKLNRKWMLVIALVLSVAMATSGTMAYLTSTDKDVNVMTLGNVKIEQHEYEREVGADGKYVTYTETERDDNPEGYKLTDFTQAKPLYPAVGTAKWDENTKVYFAQLPDDSTLGAQKVFSGLNNVQDKFVFVENTGKSDAYVRTIMAFEIGTAENAMGEPNNADANLIMMNYNNTGWKRNFIGEATIDENKYYIVEFVYDGSNGNGKHPDGIVHPGEFTYCNLAQVYLTPKATNEDVEALDGNKNGTYDILVLSQAVQTAGFADAKTALDTAFGKTSEKVAEWFGDVTPVHSVSTAAELAAALNVGGTVVLTENITTDVITVEDDVEVTLDLGGKTLTATAKSATRTNYAIDNYGTLTLTGNGEIIARGVENFGTMIVEDGVKITAKDSNGGSAIWNEGGDLTINGGTLTTAKIDDDDEVDPAALTNVNGTVVVNNCTIDANGSRCYAILNNSGSMTINNATATGRHGVVGVTGGEVTINGGTFTCEGVAGQSDHAAYNNGGTLIINGGTIQNLDKDAGGQDIYGDYTDNR